MNNSISDSNRYWQNWDKGDTAERIDRHWLRVEKDWRDMLGREIKDQLGRPPSVLEVGCGTGLIYQAMRDRGVVKPSSYVGGDVSQNMLAIARARFPGVRFVDLDIFQLAYPDRSWPAVISVHVLQHLPYYDQALSELLRVTSDILFVVSWFSTSSADELDFSPLSDDLGGQAFQNNCYSLPKFLTHILTACDRPLTSLKVRRFAHPIYAVGLAFGDPVPRKKSFLDRLTSCAHILLGS